MNIFIYDLDHKVNASYYPDSHLIKIPLELTQMLSTVYRKIKSYTGEAVYKSTHENHPCTLWIAESYANFRYAIDLFYALHDEWNERYKHDKIHKCFEVVAYIESSLSINDFTKLELTKFAQAMPDNYRNIDVVTAYRNYFNGEKLHLAKWKNDNVPKWIKRL